jgi:tRNA pseudouridine32 synthase/23S rRNA pseudouridine746 synthase
MHKPNATFSRASLPTRHGVSPSCVTLPKGAWLTVLDFLSHRFPNITLDEWLARMSRGEVLDERGNALRSNTAYRPNTRLYYYRSLPAELPIPFEEVVVYQDDLIVVADKPHFLPVTPSGRFLQESLLVRLKRKLGIATLSPAHRIDQDTAGLVLFTIQPHTRNAYQSLFRHRTVEKCYEAIAPRTEKLTLPAVVRSRVVQTASFMQMQIVQGEPNAETGIALLESNNGLARYSLRPVTGQKHQLRVQLSALGIPIVNDRIYPHLHPELPLNVQPDFSKPLQLLAKSLSFTDPVTGRPRHFESLQCLTI